MGHKNIFIILLFLAGVLAFFPANIALVIIFSITLIFACIKKVEIGIFFLAAYIPFEPFLLKFVNDEIYPYLKYGSEIIILILLIIALFKYFSKYGFKYIKTPIDIFLGIFVLISIISAILNLENPIFLILGLRQIFRYVVLYYIIIYSKLSLKISKNFITLLLFLMILQATIGLAQAGIGQPADDFLLPGVKREFAGIVSPDYVYQFWSSGQRIFATTGRYDRLGVFLCFTMLLSVGLMFEIKNKIKKRILLIISLISLPVLFFTYSRMSWIGFVLGLFLIGIIKKSRKLIIALILVIFLFSSYLGVYIISNKIMVGRIADSSEMVAMDRFLALFSIFELRNSYDSYGRAYFIVNTPLKVVKNYPLFGVGLGQYGSGTVFALNNTNKYDELGMPFGIEGKFGQIDNNWFSIWGEVGTFGLLVFIFIILSLLKFCVTVYKKNIDNFIKGLALGFIGIILAVCFQAFLGPCFEIRILSFYFWLLAALIINLNIKNYAQYN